MTFAATTYQWYLAIHILAAVLWVGRAFTIQVLAIRAARPDARLQLGSLASEIEWVGTRRRWRACSGSSSSRASSWSSCCSSCST
jgi:uncharacterized membrane protein